MERVSLLRLMTTAHVTPKNPGYPGYPVIPEEAELPGDPAETQLQVIEFHYACCGGGTGTKKMERAASLLSSPLGGGYLLSHFRSTIGVVRLNFSVRNGKRWDPHAITTLVSSLSPGLSTV